MSTGSKTADLRQLFACTCLEHHAVRLFASRQVELRANVAVGRLPSIGIAARGSTKPTWLRKIHRAGCLLRRRAELIKRKCNFIRQTVSCCCCCCGEGLPTRRRLYSAALRLLSSMAASADYTRRLEPTAFARRLRTAGQCGGLCSRLCNCPEASRLWAVWRLLQPTIQARRLRAAGPNLRRL